jgi:DNA-binding CsgD family transcriptional regulator
MDADIGSDLLSNECRGKDTSVFANHQNFHDVLFSELGKAADVADFKYQIKKIVNKMGFSDFIFRRIESGELYHAALTTMPDELLRVYSEESYYDNDLMVAYVHHNAQPIFTSQVYKYICDAPFETNLTVVNRAIEKLYSRFGFFDFYSISTKAQNGNGNVQLAIADRGLSDNDFQKKIVPYQSAFRQLCRVIDRASTDRFSTQLMAEEERNAVSITPKPLHILNKLANTDMTIAQLAEQMCISPITAHQHIAGARKALGVKTNIAAIKRAIKLKLIAFI